MQSGAGLNDKPLQVLGGLGPGAMHRGGHPAELTGHRVRISGHLQPPGSTPPCLTALLPSTLKRRYAARNALVPSPT